jgi:salicylate hydroxylase
LSAGRIYRTNRVVGLRNGLTGELVGRTGSVGLPLKYQPRRVRRTRLQAALKAKVPEGVIQLKKKLVLMEDLGADGVRLTFEDGEVAVADLVVGADGIRSVRHAPFEPGGLCWEWNLFLLTS